MRATLFVVSSLLLAGLFVAPVGSAATEPQCMERYVEIDLGPYSIVSPDSCTYTIRENPDWEPPVAIADPDCIQWYIGEFEAGPVTVEARSPCDVRITLDPGWSPGNEPDGPNCMDRYWEQEVGPVKVVSRSTCHYEVFVNGEPLLGPG